MPDLSPFINGISSTQASLSSITSILAIYFCTLSYLTMTTADKIEIEGGRTMHIEDAIKEVSIAEDELSAEEDKRILRMIDRQYGPKAFSIQHGFSSGSLTQRQPVACYGSILLVPVYGQDCAWVHSHPWAS